MSSSSLFDVLCNGSGGRLALGSTVLSYLIVYNEASAPSVFFATFLATLYALLAARCKTSLRSLQIPYIRASNKFDFGCLFLATWFDALAVLCACTILARTLSMCLDAMTGGLARILILGRNSPENEPWPDVLGVAVVFLVTGMFMLGLEHSKTFSCLMALSVFGLNAILSAVGWWQGDFREWAHDYFQPNGFNSFLTATALLCFTFPSENPVQRVGWQRYLGLLLMLLAMISLLLTSSCLSTIVHYKTVPEYIAAPVFNILNENSFNKMVPAAACLLLLTSSAAFLELFPELYNIIKRYATSEWRILSKQISYESSESGNPVLAVFIAGSLCAMLAFACPLQNLVYTLAASYLSAVVFRAFYALYIPFRPKFLQQSSSESSLSYSRLSTAPLPSTSSTTSIKSKRSLWKLNLPKQKSTKRQKPKAKVKKELEKEWLLLGEPTSPLPQREAKDVELAVLSDNEPGPSEFEFTDRHDKSDSDSSTDIDAIVDEYREKVKVTTAGPIERSVRVPNLSSWRVTIFAMAVAAFGMSLTVAGIAIQWAPATCMGILGVFTISIMMTLLPQYTSNAVNISPLLSCNLIMFSVILFAACAEHSWPGIVFAFISGLLMLIRCDNYCCNCLDDQMTLTEQLIPNVSSKASSMDQIPIAGSSTTICMPSIQPPKHIVTIPTRVTGLSR